MSHFYGSIQGNRGEVTRCGSKESGISGHIRGWGVGARVNCYVDKMGDDVVEIYRTSGSGYFTGNNKCRIIARFSEKFEVIGDDAEN